MKSVEGFLVDLDGVLYVEQSLIPGAVETINWMRGQGLPFRFLTNTTVRSRKSLWQKLRNFGIDANLNEIFSTCVVAARWLKQKDIYKVHLLLPEVALEDFSEFENTEKSPQAVVVGDLGKDFNYENLNQAFRLIKNGAKLIGLQKNRYWETLGGLSMDVGPFVAALEYATETEAIIIGKPNRAYFQMALEDLNMPPSKVAMVGDDIYTDILGGDSVGTHTILVRTGKSQYDDLSKAEVKPDRTIKSIAELPEILTTR